MSTLTPDTILKQLGYRVEQYRIRFNLTQAKLAKEAGIGKRTLERLESGQPVQITSLIAILRQFDLLDGFINLLPNPDDSPMAQLQNEKEVRHRASRRAKKESTEPWTWND